MQIIAQRGSRKAHSFLVDMDGQQGFVADTLEGRRWPPRPIGEIAKFGYWEDYAGSQDQLPELLALPLVQITGQPNPTPLRHPH